MHVDFRFNCGMSLSLIWLALPQPAHGKSLELSQTDSVITIRQDGQVVVAYNKVSPPTPAGIDPVYRRSGCLHPVSSPLGRTVTDVFPADHPHQHGIFSAWVKTTYDGRPVNFWDLAGGTGRVLHEKIVSTFQSQTSAGFEVDLLHRAEGPPAVNVLRERWKVTAFPTDGSYHCFELATTQTALTDKPLIVNEYHYGGVALRGPTRWVIGQDAANYPNVIHEPSAFLNNLRSDRIKGNHEHAKWVALTGSVDGEPVTVAVLSHVDNFRAPQAARLHPTKPYFCYAPCVDGTFAIDRDHPYHAVYRYLITDAAPDPEWIDEQWEDWCGK
jgi:Family of unknown function (DUF6807)